MKKKIAVIGGGISGITAASILNDGHDVTVFEGKPFVGGLVHCDKIEGFLYHRVGGHVFNSRNQKVLDWFWNKFDKESEFISTKRNAKILYEGKLIGYPIENFLFEFPPSIVEKIIGELIEINQGGIKESFEYSNFEEFLKNNFGSTLYELYFKPYNQKIWKVELSTVPMGWLEGKLPMPNLKEILINNINRQEENKMVHSTFFYPKENGSQFIVDRLASGLNIETNKQITSIKRNGNENIVLGEAFHDIVYTGDIRRLPDVLDASFNIPLELIQKIQQLRSNGTSSILCECDVNDLSWLYIPDPKLKAHRIIYTGNFSSNNNAKTSSRSSCTVEFSGICSYEDMKAELVKMPGNLVPIGFNVEPNSYVVQDENTRMLINDFKSHLSKFGIHLLGRFGEWEYYNMDKAIEAAFELSIS